MLSSKHFRKKKKNVKTISSSLQAKQPLEWLLDFPVIPRSGQRVPQPQIQRTIIPFTQTMKRLKEESHTSLIIIILSKISFKDKTKR